MKRYLVFGLLAVMVTVLGGCGFGPEGVNGNASVAAGQKAGSVSRVNGSLDIGADATIEDASTVNGNVKIGPRVTATDVNTVNGSVSLGEGSKIAGSVTTVNGSLTLDNGADVAGTLTNVNGDIRLDRAHVGGDIVTVNADIDVGAESRIDGGIQMHKSKGVVVSLDSRIPRIVIGPGAVVQGPMKFEREVKLYVSDTATIGAVEGATAEKFSGPTPPG